MRIDFLISSRDDEERKIEEEFCRSILNYMKAEILRSASYDKLNKYETSIIKTTFINWVNKPKSIDMRSFMVEILNNLVWNKNTQNNTYTIEFRNVNLKNTRTPTDAIARFIDKGNEDFSGIHIFSMVFNLFEKNMESYWEMFVYRNLGRVSVSEVLIIK